MTRKLHDRKYKLGCFFDQEDKFQEAFQAFQIFVREKLCGGDNKKKLMI